jgi:ribonucleoside-diphosphate reductase alpha chain
MKAKDVDQRSRLNGHAIEVLESRYLLRDKRGRIKESPEELFHRVASVVAEAERDHNEEGTVIEWEDRFFEMMSSLDFLPNSPTLMNAGTAQGQLSACFVLPVEDNIESIFSTLKDAALIQKSGGGTGFDFSPIRPRGHRISSTSGKATGPLSFIRIFDAATDKIKQGGKRRGANMGILRIDHPDIVEFIEAKTTHGGLHNFNLSVLIPDSFMGAVENDGEWFYRDPQSGEKTKPVQAKWLWELIGNSAWHSGDPGILFIDAINRTNPLPQLGAIHATNPCGELPLLPYESCNLGSINLANFIIEENEDPKVDWERLKKIVQQAVRFLDDVITINSYTLPSIEESTLRTRKIGLGIMGWADMLIKLGIPYDCRQAVGLAKDMMKFIGEEAKAYSSHLGEIKGNFPAWKESIYAHDEPMRNATRTAIAPTGSISIIADTSSSIEPLFGLAYRRIGILDNKSQLYTSSLFMEKAKERNVWSEQLMPAIYNQGNLSGIHGIPCDLKRLFKTSLEIPWQWHIKHQAAFQEYTDSAVSKTINMPEESKPEEISEALHYAWKSGVKGVTIFRNGSRKNQVFKLGNKKCRPC